MRSDESNNLVEAGTIILNLQYSTWWVWLIKVGVVAQNFHACLHMHTLELPLYTILERHMRIFKIMLTVIMIVCPSTKYKHDFFSAEMYTCKECAAVFCVVIVSVLWFT